ncbi:MAG: GIY-YIG nuclease family protein [Candidatus Pelagadaptatus aseana]|uniref:GIY-YIG nuclease family protein n=1 Tax=Candidatus Pelagadaptatus aseana TaxID=3120508 RepID=UPI0039B2D4A9
MIESSDHRLYTGITNNLPKRWKAHTEGKTGAKFFRGRSPSQLLYVETNHDRSSASKREAAIKQLKRSEKLLLVAEQRDQDWHQVYSL